MKRILIIGPAPTRIGGVSIHITRLAWLLRNEYSFDYIDEARGKVEGFYNFRCLNLIPYFKKVKHADIVHIHSAVFVFRVFHILVAKFLLRKPVCVSIHHDLSVEGHIGFTRRLLKCCNCAILDSQDIYDSVFVQKSRCEYKLMPAFLPPIVETEDELPSDIVIWLKEVRKDPQSILMCSSSSNIKDYNGADLYGNDMSIDAVRILNSKLKNKTFYLLLIVHNSENSPDKLRLYEETIARQSPDNILLVKKPISFLRVMKEADVVLRPTNTDGDSITIREALYFSKATVASDCAVRPEGTTVFKTRDINDFCEKILLSISNKDNRDSQSIDYKTFYKGCYEDYCGIRK